MEYENYSVDKIFVDTSSSGVRDISLQMKQNTSDQLKLFETHCSTSYDSRYTFTIKPNSKIDIIKLWISPNSKSEIPPLVPMYVLDSSTGSNVNAV